MTDIINRLREDARGGYAYHELSDEAADEIERLRALIVRQQAALDELVSLGEKGMAPDYNEWLTFHDKVAQIACRALEGK